MRLWCEWADSTSIRVRKVHRPALAVLPHDWMDRRHLVRCCVHIFRFSNRCEFDDRNMHAKLFLVDWQISHYFRYRQYCPARCGHRSALLWPRPRFRSFPPSRQARSVQLDLLCSGCILGPDWRSYRAQDTPLDDGSYRPPGWNDGWSFHSHHRVKSSFLCN